MSDEKAPSLEEMFRRVKRSGYRINNLCHRLDGMWQCSLRAARPGVAFFEWGYGVDAAHAIEKAMDKALSGKMVFGPPVDPDDMDPTTTGNQKDSVQPIPAGEEVGGLGDMTPEAEPAEIAVPVSAPAAELEEEDLIG